MALHDVAHDVAGTSRGNGSHPFPPGGCLWGCFRLPAEHWLHKGAAAALGQGTGGPNKLTMTASSNGFWQFYSLSRFEPLFWTLVTHSAWDCIPSNHCAADHLRIMWSKNA